MIHTMLCLAALIVLATLGIFSIRHRRLAREAFNCVLRRITLRPCEMKFGQKMKMEIVSWLAARSDLAARFFNRYAEVLAWLFVTFSLISTLYAGRGLYNLVRFGSCNPQDPTSCVVNNFKLPFIQPGLKRVRCVLNLERCQCQSE